MPVQKEEFFHWDERPNCRHKSAEPISHRYSMIARLLFIQCCCWLLTRILFFTSSNCDWLFCPKSISLTFSFSTFRLRSMALMSRSKLIQFCRMCDNVSIWLSIEFIEFVHFKLMSVFWRWILSRFGWSATGSNFSVCWFNKSIWSWWACE